MGKKRENLNAIIFVIVAIVIIVAFLVMVFFNSGLSTKFTKAVDVNGHDVKTNELQFYYSYELNNFTNENQDYMSYLGLDLYGDLKKQPCTIAEDMTWHDYFVDAAIGSMTDIYMLCDQAEAAGFALTAEDYEEIQGTVDYFEYSAGTSGYSMNGYLHAAYGKGVNEKLFTKVITQQFLADKYQNHMVENVGSLISEDEIDAYYNEHASDFDLVSYRSFLVVSGTSTDMEEAEKTEKIEAAEAIAKDMAASVKTEQDFIDLAYENVSEENKSTYENESATLYTNTMTYLSTAEGDDYAWLASSDRKSGDTTYINVGDNFRVLMYLSRELDDAPGCVDVTMITANIENGDTEAAKGKMDAIVAQYEANPTYENFQSLVSQGDSFYAEGGVIEDMTSGSFGVSAVDAWIFDGERQVGDAEAIQGTNAFYFVYINDIEVKWHYDSRIALTRDAYSDWFEDVAADYTVTLKPAANKVGR